MSAFLIIGVTILVYLPCAILLHRIGQRRANFKLGRVAPTQGVALKAVMFALAVEIGTLVCACALGTIEIAWAVWTAFVIAGLGYCYWLLTCMTESGRRYMIAEMVAQDPGITPSEIVARYNRVQIIEVRLDRLSHWGTLYQREGRYFARPSMMLLASKMVRAWALILGFRWAKLFGVNNAN